MMNMYIHGNLIPKISKGMSNSTIKSKLLENYGLILLFQKTAEEWLIKIGFKFNYYVNNNDVGGHGKKEMIWYRCKFIDIYILL